MAPNVLLFLTDQQRSDTLGFRHQTPCRTPNIDRIAAEGISFDRAITPSPLCVPARAALFTGRYPTRNGMMANEGGVLSHCELLEHFRAAGYRVNYAGKWHLGDNNIAKFTDRHGGDSTATYTQWCLGQGLIDGWMFNDPRTRTRRTPSMSTPEVHRQDLPVDKTNEAYITDIAIDMIRNREHDRPFFQVCSYNGPHPPFMIPEPFFSMYDPAIVTRPVNFGPQPGEHLVNRTSFYRRLFEDQGTDFNDWRASYAVYWGFVTMIDTMIGRVMNVLEEEGLLEDTIIVFASDHGENLGAHGLWHKMVPYDESIRVPLIIRPPGRAVSGRRTHAPASLVDVAPTLSALCGLDRGQMWDGRDLWSSDWENANRPAVFAMHRPLGDWMNVTDWRMVESDRLKYVWYRGEEDELFDLDSDPDELDNLADNAEYHSRLVYLRAELASFLAATNDPLLSAWTQDA